MELQRFAENFRLPVAVTFRRQMLFPADHRTSPAISVSDPIQSQVAEADPGVGPVLLVGGRLSEMPSQSYTLLDIRAMALGLCMFIRERRN